MLKIDSLTMHYGTRRVVDQVSLQVAPGEVVALIGPNGAGKTTIVRGISGVTEVTSGSVLFNDIELTHLSPPERARIMAVVPQVSYLGGAFTVEQVVMMGRTAYMSWIGKPSEEDHYIVEQAMESTQTTSLAQRRIAELSGGEQQRVMLARALAQSTPLLILDEPTNHLDLQHQGTLLSLVREQAYNGNLAVLMVLHDLNLVSLFADKAALMVDGRLSAFGSPEEVLSVETISQAYHADIEVIYHPKSNTPIILQKN
ncbi:heme ABC transporter ATP-binding protein [bacterium]|nr:heme ABC transporter ATP-binding protein [bacterium]MCB2179074.1 heme ABC transporter ATP-binding protein [bacterium]